MTDFTDKEMAVIKTMRQGAGVNLTFKNIHSNARAREVLTPFAEAFGGKIKHVKGVDVTNFWNVVKVDPDGRVNCAYAFLDRGNY